MIVMKFGGTSLGNAERIKVVLDLVKDNFRLKPVVVVSAHAGVTNLLLKAAAVDGDFEKTYDEIIQRHRDILRSLDLGEDLVNSELQELHELLRGIHLVRELTPRTRDYAASFGERISSKIIAAYFSHQGLAATAVNAYDVGFITDSNFGDAILIKGQQEEVADRLNSMSKLPVVTGFIGKNRQGDITTMGRGGSDTTAAIIGGALNVKEIQIWTDVDGVMTAPPKMVPSAQSIPRMTFDEAAELAFFGARVLHPDCLWPAVQNNIPVRVLNTYKPDHPGTVICNEVEPGANPVRAIVFKENQILFNIISSRMLMSYGFMARVFDVFSRYCTPVDMIATSEVSISLTVALDENLEEIVKELSHFSEVTVKKYQAIVCVVGSHIQGTVGIPGHVFEVLRRHSIDVRMISVGASKINISFVIDNSNIEKTVQELHLKFFNC
ncbi:aspartate kinase [Planctomycetota bacterium]